MRMVTVVGIAALQAAAAFLPVQAETGSQSTLIEETAPGHQGLRLVKIADKATAAPGDTIIYRVTFTNQGASPLRKLSVHDAVPAFTGFSAAGVDSLPVGLTLAVLTHPAAGDTGLITWEFSGDLPPGGAGTVTFSVALR